MHASTASTDTNRGVEGDQTADDCDIIHSTSMAPNSKDVGKLSQEFQVEKSVSTSN